ncbi:MAG: anaerobic ribonucleoside-triphosphate reductase [Cetobacterium sp.]
MEFRTQVIKKNGQVEDFKDSKIINAVKQAYNRCGKELSIEEGKYIIDSIKLDIGSFYMVCVDDLHRLVIEAIKDKEVSKAYSDYRGYKERFHKTFNSILEEEKVLLDEGSKENANKNTNLIATKKELTGGIVSKHLVLEHEINKEYAKAHKDGDLYNHDLMDELFNSINCCLFDMENVLKDGFYINGVHKEEPNHLESAVDITVDIILSASGQQFGK